jgi:hypothetical protein
MKVALENAIRLIHSPPGALQGARPSTLKETLVDNVERKNHIMNRAITHMETTR